jgi:hypothetical protein
MICVLVVVVCSLTLSFAASFQMDAVVRGDVLLLCRQAPSGDLIFRYSFHTTFVVNSRVRDRTLCTLLDPPCPASVSPQSYTGAQCTFERNHSQQVFPLHLDHSSTLRSHSISLRRPQGVHKCNTRPGKGRVSLSAARSSPRRSMVVCIRVMFCTLWRVLPCVAPCHRPPTSSASTCPTSTSTRRRRRQ